MDLAEFLLARIDEDEAAAGGAFRDVNDGSSPDFGMTWWAAGDAVMAGQTYVLEQHAAIGDTAVAEHAARHDPARILAECDAKRRIVTEFGFQCSEYGAPGSELRAERQAFADEMGYRFEPHWPEEYAGFCDGCAAAQSADNGHARVLRILAAPYADHPDYRSEWAP